MTRTGIAISMLASIAAATVVTGSVLTRADATDGAQPNTSCATTTACIEGDNTTKGPGVKGTSTKGYGAIGTTKAKPTIFSDGRAGLLGQDLQTSLQYIFNAGVEGTSTNGIGILGQSPNGVGVWAIGYNGVTAEGGPIGLYGVGSQVSIQADGDPSGDSFLAVSSGTLYRGNNGLGDTFIVDSAGDVSATGVVDASNDVEGLEGLFGSQSISGQGVVGASATEGVEGENSSSGDAIFANGFGGLLFRANNSSAQNVFEVDDTGEVFAVGYNFIADATKLQHTSMGQIVKTYSSQAAQPTLEDNGEAQLVDGMARVALDPAFGATIDPSNYMVQVTPEGMTRGVLCVTQRTPSGFVVQENMGGRSSVPFSYRIVARPYGSTAPRLPLATIPGHFGARVAKTRIVPHIYKAPRHAKTIVKPLALMRN